MAFLFAPRSPRLALVSTLLATVGITLSALLSPSWADNIPWQALNLTPQQSQTMQQLDTQWQGTYSQLQPQIEQDQSTLKQLIHAPTADSQQVMHIQGRLQRNRDTLHQSATRIFMEKKERLTPEQRQHLQRLMDK